MKLSQKAVDELLHIIADFDRERGIPHNYMDLEKELKLVDIEPLENILHITSQYESYEDRRKKIK